MPKKKLKSRKEILFDLFWPGVQLCGLIFFAWLNATHFDQTELKMLGEFAAYWAIIQKVKGAVEI